MIERDLANNHWAQAFGACLRLLRKKAGMSQEQFAKKIGIKQTSLSKFERCAFAPTLWTIYRVSSRLKLPPAVLFGRETGEPLPKSYEAFRRRFSRRLKKARMERDLSQKELAEMINTHQPTYSDIENAVTVRDKPEKLSSPDLETIRHIAAALRVDPLSLFLD